MPDSCNKPSHAKMHGSSESSEFPGQNGGVMTAGIDGPTQTFDVLSSSLAASQALLLSANDFMRLDLE